MMIALYVTSLVLSFDMHSSLHRDHCLLLLACQHQENPDMVFHRRSIVILIM